MKNFKSWGLTLGGLVLIFFFLTLVSGCGKPDGPEPIQPTKNPELNAWASNEVINFGGSVVVDYNSKELDSLILNQVRLSSLSGKITLVSLESDTTLNFLGYYTSSSGGGTKTTEVKTLTKTVKITVKPEVLPDPPTLTVTVAPDTIPYGESAVITIASDGDSISSNLPSFTGVSGDFNTPALFETTTYTFTAFNKGGEKTESISVVVLPFVIPTREDTLMAHPWVPDSIWYRYSVEDEWSYWSPDLTLRYAIVYVFCPDSLVKEYLLPNYLLTSTPNSRWYFTAKDKLFFIYDIKDVKKLTLEVFIYETTSSSGIFVKVKNIPTFIP